VPVPYIFNFDSIASPSLRNYASGAFEQIEGWGLNHYFAELLLSLDEFQKSRDIRGNVFEIGVYHGRVLIMLGLMTTEEERLIGLDLFDTLQSRNIDRSGAPAGGGALFDKVQKNLELYGLLGKADMIIADSMFADFSKHPNLKNIRFAHIDGGHYPDALVNDLVKTQQIMVPGGVVIVDDYIYPGFPGVNEGLFRFMSFATPRLVVPFAVGANKLFLTTHSHHADMLAHLRSVLPWQTPVKVHGFDAISVEKN
jgi:hypothetical protein